MPGCRPSAPCIFPENPDLPVPAAASFSLPVPARIPPMQFRAARLPYLTLSPYLTPLPCPMLSSYPMQLPYLTLLLHLMPLPCPMLSAYPMQLPYLMLLLHLTPLPHPMLLPYLTLLLHPPQRPPRSATGFPRPPAPECPLHIPFPPKPAPLPPFLPALPVLRLPPRSALRRPFYPSAPTCPQKSAPPGPDRALPTQAPLRQGSEEARRILSCILPPASPCCPPDVLAQAF